MSETSPSGQLAGLIEWSALSESLLRGLVHSLNNRLSALTAFGELAAMGDAEFAPERVLPGELARLHQVGALFRLLASEDMGPEALEPGPVIDDALALHAHHARLRAVRCDVVMEGARTPVRVPRWALLRLVLVVVEAAKCGVEARGREMMTLRIVSDEHGVVLHAEGAEPSPYARAMAALCGATITDDGDGAVVRIPSLLDIRRREREARG